MHFFSKSVAMTFPQALAAAKQALKRHDFAILAEVDVREALKQHLAVDFRPYVVVSACSLKLLRRTLQADGQKAPVWLSNVVVQDQGQGYVDVSAVDPACSVGTINDIDAIYASNELRGLLLAAIGELGKI
jgi:uncharacterized protein (DUF302 family)